MQQINIKENKQICHSQLLNKTKYYNNKTENSLYSEDYRSQSTVLEHILNKKKKTKSKIPVTLVIQISKHVKKIEGKYNNFRPNRKLQEGMAKLAVC